MNPAISIIVPVYNVEPYLRQCIDSILAQTFTDFEVILVDDGSPDNCGAICDEYAAKDSRVVVIHQKNCGVSAARNAGLDIARGKYAMFCDSDDYVDSQWCQLLYNTIVKHPNAWISCCVAIVGSDGQMRVNAPKLKSETDIQRIPFYELYQASLSGSPCNKIYRKDILEQHHIRFNTNYKIGEDTDFNVRYYAHCNDALCIPQVLYHYCTNESGAINSYRYNSFDLYRHTYFDRLPYIEEVYMEEYLDNWLWRFLKMLEDPFKQDSPLNLLQKFTFCQKMMNTEEFRHCVAHAPGKQESKLFMRIIRYHNFYLYWFFQKMCIMKRKLSMK